MSDKSKYTSEKVQFHNDELIAIDVDGNIEVVFKFLVESLGLNYDSAVSGLKNDEILGAEHAVRPVQVGENQARNYLTLPIQRVEGWLFSIQTGKVSSDIRGKLILYKKECYQVLHEHFRGKHRKIRLNSMERIRIKEEMNVLNKKIVELKNKLKVLEKEDKQIHLSLVPTLFDFLKTEAEAASDNNTPQ